MTAPINMALYRLLLKAGATEDEAEAAARLEGAADLATKADLRLEMAQLKADLQRFILQTMIAMTAIFVAAVTALRILVR